MAKRKATEVNAGSMADIAFLLLVFFLVTTTMDTDTGLVRKLPPPVPKDVKPPDVKERNIMKILVNKRDRLLVNNKEGSLYTLKDEVKDFMSIHPNNESYPEINIKSIELLGDVPTSKGIVSLKNDRGTSYEMYIQVQNELARAFKELRDELSMEKFGKKYSKLVKEEQKKAIEAAVPMRISEAEPENIGGN